MKLLKVAVAALVMAAMVTPVIAEDRLSLSGEMRVRGWHIDNSFDNYVDSKGETVKDSDGTSTYGDQRLRIGGKIAVAEGVSVTFRTDITESTWGTNNGTAADKGKGYFGSGRSGGDQQWDRAHLDLSMGNFHLRAGQFLHLYGMNDAVDSQDNGLSMDYLVGPGSFNAFFMVDDANEEGTTSGNDASDAILSGVKYSGKGDTLGYDVFLANFNDGSEKDVYVFGLGMNLDLDAINLKAELNVFDGDHAEKTATTKAVDAMGTQLQVDASLAASDAAKVGAQFFYAAGDDKDKQYTGIGNGFNGWDPIFDIGTNLSNEQITGGNPFNVASVGGYEGASVSAASAGSIGGRLYVNFTASEDLYFGASGGYFQSEEDKIADIDYMAFAGGLVYNIMENTSFHLQAQYTDGTVNETKTVLAGQGDKDFDSFRAGTGLFVKF